MAVYQKYARYARMTIYSLRVVGCKLPIVVYHGRGELDDATVAGFRAMEGVSVVDLTRAVPAEQLSGFSYKVFSLLVAPFEEVLLVDADTVFLHNPEEVFEDPRYHFKGGMVLWKVKRASHGFLSSFFFFI